jgi:hypothetical protein
MSHIAVGKCRLHDLGAIEVACNELGLELVRDQRTYTWFNQFLGDSASGRDAVRRGMKPEDMGKCLHAIRFKNHQRGQYEAGLVSALDGKGGFNVVFDEWGSGRQLSAALGGLDTTKLQDAYNRAVAYRTLAQQGYRVTQTKNAQGELQLVAVKA